MNGEEVYVCRVCGKTNCSRNTCAPPGLDPTRAILARLVGAADRALGALPADTLDHIAAKVALYDLAREAEDHLRAGASK